MQISSRHKIISKAVNVIPKVTIKIPNLPIQIYKKISKRVHTCNRTVQIRNIKPTQYYIENA